MGNKQGTLGHHLETASKTGALAFPDKKLESFPDDLTKVSGTLRNLDLSRNKIPALPSFIASFKLLKTLNLTGNRLTELTPVLGKLTKLETLLVGSNLIQKIPDNLGSDLKNLKDVDLSDNRLTTVPLTLTQCRKLDSVNLSGNRITAVPDTQGNHAIENFQVTELNLNQNQIASVSSGIAKCPRLKTLRLEENCLSLEALPVEILTQSQVSTLGHKGNLFTEKQLADVEGYEAYMSRYTAVKRKLD